MKTALCILMLMACAVSGFGQKTTVWKGGKPGRAQDWHCPANWSTYRVPDEFSDVVIPENLTRDGDYPVIKISGCEVNTLRIARGARITISEAATLRILNPDYCEDVSRIIAMGRLILPDRSAKETILALRNH